MCTVFGPRFSAEKSYTSFVSAILHTVSHFAGTVEPRYNEDLRTMKITLL